MQLQRDRIDDALIDEGPLHARGHAVVAPANASTPRSFSGHEFIGKMGARLLRRGQGSHVRTAHEAGVPVFGNAFDGDSLLGSTLRERTFALPPTPGRAFDQRSGEPRPQLRFVAQLG
ncbi:hypothetical protein HPC49_17915 [Pyxidicoccus fallax]|uniref:Uncharacterized protein n=1 Tax=Pyxidicoccus fallax TaxID=394095 RepID=A0A848LL86_9BACT|nr:hypothetical protein [Pyxidicoccus fallax]NMO18508.1 hypothetical protein [Pyxidicoccus fallax]NPC80088.1 hypothetical protein [Pyxidicoccus fallax]